MGRKDKVFGILSFIILCFSIITLFVFTQQEQSLIRQFISDELRNAYDSDTYHVVFYDSDKGETEREVLWQADVPAGYTLILDGTASDENKTFVYEGEIPTRTGYVFDSWISDTGSYTISEDTNFTAHFVTDEIYMISVKYQYANGNIARDTYVGTAKFNESYSIETPNIEGYTRSLEKVEGTITEENLEELNNKDYASVQWIETSDGSRICRITVTVTYNPAPSKYTVNHYKQKTDGQGYDLYETTTYDENIFIGDVVTTEAYSFEGFTVNQFTSVFETSVAANGETSLNIYYDRDIYYIYYNSAGGTYYEPEQVLYEATIKNIEDPERAGYEFAGWKWSTSLNGEEITKPTTMSTNNLYAVATWTTTTTGYSITYYTENPDDEEYSFVGEAHATAITETILNIEDVVADITSGFQDTLPDEYMYFTYNEEKTIASNDENDLKVNGDGSTVIKVYFDRNEYTLNFILGGKSGSTYQIYTNSETLTTATSNVTLNINNNEYTIDSTINYTITAKYGENIAELWPYASLDVSPSSQQAGSSWNRRTYYPYGWNYQRSGASSYTTQVSGIYTLNKDLIQANSDGTYTGVNFYLLWTTSASTYTVHYMFETLDGTGTLYSGSYDYYSGSYFKENEAYQTKITGTSMGYKTIDGFNYYSSASSERNNYDIYLYYLRDTYTLTFYNINQVVMPNISNSLLTNGISMGTDCLNIKYGTNISSLANVGLESSNYPVNTLGTGDWTFEKWYTDAYCALPMEWSDESGNGTVMSSNLMLYANWIAPEYDVTFDVNEGNWLDISDKYVQDENGDYIIKAQEGDSLTAPAEPERIGYEFDGWYYTTQINGEEKELQYLFSESQAVYDNLILTAKWNPDENIVYTVKYVEAQYDGDTLITDISKYTDPVYIQADKVVSGNKFGVTVTENATQIQGENINIMYLPDTATKSLVLNSTNESDNVIYFFYTKMRTVTYTVYHVIDTGIKYESGEIPSADVLLAKPKQESITAPGDIYVECESLDIDGYQALTLKQNVLLISEERNNTIYFYYKANETTGDYKINFYFMKENDNYEMTPDYVATGSEPSGVTIYAKDYAKYLDLGNELYQGHTFDEELSDKFGIITSSEEITILNLYFKNIIYDVNYYTQEGTWTDTNTVFTQIDEQTYNSKSTYWHTAEEPTVPTKDGYRFLGWYGKDETNTFTENPYGFSKNITSDTNLYAVWVEETDIDIVKIWNDGNNRDGIRTSNVEITVNNYGDITLTQANEQDKNTWKTTISADKYNYKDYEVVLVYINENGEEIVAQTSVIDDTLTLSGMYAIPTGTQFYNGDLLEDVVNSMTEVVYSASEKNVPEGYKDTYSEDTFTITNTHEPTKTSGIVTKVWEDNENQDGIRPENLKLHLKMNGELAVEVTLSESNNWTYEWKDLYAYEDGKEIEYTVEETEVPTGYTDTYDRGNMKVTNTHIPEKTTRTVTKVWEDNENQDGKRPNEVKVQLLANGVEKDSEIALNESNNWTYTYENLDKFANGNEITYTIKEITEIEGYTTEYSDDTFTITNTHTPEKINKTVTKLWEDNNDQDGKRTDEIKVQLKANGENSGEVITVTEEAGWTYTWENVYKYANGSEIKYTVEEIDVPEGYSAEYNQDTLTITNKHTPEVADKTVTKVWRDGDNKEGFRTDSIEVQLYANGEKVGDSVVITSADATDGDNNWQHTWNDLDVYKDGEKINYTVEELVVPDKYGVRYAQDRLTIYNAYPPEVNVVIEKIWDDNNDGDGLRAEEIQVQLLADGEIYQIDGENIGLVTLNEANNWKYEFEFLEKYNSNSEKYVYTIEEITEVPKYTTVYTQELSESEYVFEIINTYSPETTQRTVVNTWDDSENQDGKRPDELIIELYANDEKLEEVKLIEANNWTYDWTSLFKNANKGQEIEYTIEVKDSEGYTSTVEYDETTKTFFVESTHIPERVNKTITKVWDDNNNQDGKRQNFVNVELYANGERVGQATLEESNGWSKQFENLYKYKDGIEIEYTAQEEAVPEYTFETKEENDVITVINTHIPETKSLTVEKIWEDDNDRDGIRPTAVNVELLADGVTKETATLLETSGWKHTWNNLEVYVNGKEIEYTIKEISEIKDYTTDYETNGNTFKITNTHIPYTVQKTVKKIWNDSENQDGKRPDDALIQLYADGKKYGEPILLNEANSWTYTWTELPERASVTTVLEDGTVERKIHKIKYTAQEATVPDGYDAEYSEDTFTITNTHLPNIIEKQVTKIWDDAENKNYTRSNEINVVLLADGVEKEAVVLSDENNWSYKWSDLYQYSAGKEIEYSVKEIDSIENYETSYSEDTFTITNTLKEYDYTIEYYYEGTLNSEETVTGKELFGNVINTYEDKVIEGYKLDREENASLTITSDPTQNIMRIYYVKDEFDYTIEYYYNGQIDDSKTVTGSELFETEISGYEDKILDGYKLKEVVNNPLKITADEAENVMKVYYEKDSYDYTIEYYYDGIVDNDKTIADKAIFETKIDTYEKKNINGYKLEKVENLPLTITSTSSNNIIKVYYVKDEFDYSIEYYYDGIIDSDKTVKGKALYQSTIDTYDSKEEYGYRLDSVENLPLVIDYDLTKNVIKVNYVRKDTKVVVNHIDINTNQVLDTVTTNGKVGDKYSTESIDIEKYVLVKSPDVTEGEMTEETITVNYYYVHVSEGVIEKHIDKITGDVLESTVHTGNEGDEYTTTEKNITGYTRVNELPENATGNMTIDVIEVKYYYIKNITINVNYVDINTKEKIKVEEVSGLEGNEYTTAEKTFEEFEFIEEQRPADAFGKFDRNDTEVNYYYVRKTKLIVQRINKFTNEKIQPDETKNGIQNEFYETEATEIEGYILLDEELPENAKGQLEVTKNQDGTYNVETIVKYYYWQKAKVIVQYIDKANDKILQTEEIEGLVDDNYETNSKKIPAYELIEDATNKSGKMTAEDIVVKYYYKRNSFVTVEYIDENTDEKISEDTVLEGREKDPYNVQGKDIEGYVLTRTLGKESGEMTKEDITVRFYYKRATKLIVRYLEADSQKELLPLIEEDKLENDLYSTEYKDVPYYKLKEVPNNATGKLTMNKMGDVTVVTYYYEKQVFDLAVDSFVEDVTINGVSAGRNKELIKAELDKSFDENTVLKATYKIKIKNIGEVAGRATSIVDYLPDGFEFIPEENEDIWLNEGSKIKTDALKDVVLHPGEEKELTVILNWIANDQHFGTLENKVVIEDYANVPGFVDVNLRNNVSETEFIMTIKTGGAYSIENIEILLFAIIVMIMLFEQKIRMLCYQRVSIVERKNIRQYVIRTRNRND